MGKSTTKRDNGDLQTSRRITSNTNPCRAAWPTVVHLQGDPRRICMG